MNVPPLRPGHSLRYIHTVRTPKGLLLKFVCGCGAVGAPLKNLNAASKAYEEHLNV